MARSSMAVRCIILKRDKSVPLPNKMDQVIALAINRVLSYQKVPAPIWIMNEKSNTKGAISALTHQSAIAAMAQVCSDAIINIAHTVDKVVIDVEECESWERLKAHVIPHVRYMGEGTECQQKMRDEIHAENEKMVIPVQVRWLANPHSIRERRQRGEISASSVIFVVRGNNMARRLVNEGIKAAGMRYRVEPFMNGGPD